MFTPSTVTTGRSPVLRLNQQAAGGKKAKPKLKTQRSTMQKSDPLNRNAITFFGKANEGGDILPRSASDQAISTCQRPRELPRDRPEMVG